MSDKRKGHRQKSKRVKTAKGRKPSSTKWLQRQLNDPYVELAKKEGYRSRAAYKLLEIQEKFKILKPGYSVVDLGAAPGSWTQVALELIGKKSTVVGIDLLEMDPINGMEFIQGDFLDNDVETELLKLVPEKVDVVMSDLAANTTGHSATDHLRTMALCETAYDFAIKTLKDGGCFFAKTFKGGTEGDLLNSIKKDFDEVKHFKPKSSRKESPETYIVAIGFNKKSD